VYFNIVPVLNTFCFFPWWGHIRAAGSKTEKVWRVLDARFPWVPQGCPWSFLVPVHQNWTLFQVSGQIDGIFNSGAGQLPSAWPDSHTQLGCFWSDVGSPCVLGRSWSILRASFMHPLVPALMQQRQTHFCMWKNTALLLSARLKRRKVWKPFFFFFNTLQGCSSWGLSKALQLLTINSKLRLEVRVPRYNYLCINPSWSTPAAIFFF